MIEQPMITIMVSYYNDNEYLKESIESILNQTYQNFELILLNHASTDNSREVAHSFKDKRIIHIDYPVNLGAMSGELYYHMLKYAKGKYVKFFSADDTLKTNAIENLVDYMEQHPKIDFAFGNVEYVNANSISYNDTWFESRPNFSLDYSKEELIDIYFNIKYSVFPFAGHIIKKEILTKNNFNNSFILLFDMFLWLSLMIEGRQFGLIDKIVANYRIHDGQLTSLSKRYVTSIRMKYEPEYYRKCLFKIKNLNLIKFLCNESKYIDRADSEKDIDFILAEYLFNKYHSITAYNILNDLLNNENTMVYLRDKFNFTVGTLRELYSRNSSNRKQQAIDVCSVLSIWQILYAFVFRVINKIICVVSTKRNKQKKEYSL